jgi:hypothetical protein
LLHQSLSEFADWLPLERKGPDLYCVQKLRHCFNNHLSPVEYELQYLQRLLSV